VVAAGTQILPVDATRGLWPQISCLVTLIAIGLFSYASLLYLFGVLNFSIIRQAFNGPSRP
jgi:hypothetical protein